MTRVGQHEEAAGRLAGHFLDGDHWNPRRGRPDRVAAFVCRLREIGA